MVPTRVQQNGIAVDVDSVGNIYAVGFTYGNLNGETKFGAQDLFLAKFDPSGAILWTRLLGATGALTRPYGIDIDASDNIYITGSTTRGLNGNLKVGDTDCFLAKYSISGDLTWLRQFGVASKSIEGRAVKTDSSGNVFVAGQTGGKLDEALFFGTSDGFIVKYSPEGVKR